MSTIDASRLRAAADYIKEHGWLQGSLESTRGAVCASGAIRLCSPMDGDTFLIEGVLRKKDRLERWNDVRGRTEAEVVEFLSNEVITDEVLAQTYGPQWQAVVTFVRRCMAITEDEKLKLAEAHSRQEESSPKITEVRERVIGIISATGRSREAESSWDAAWDTMWHGPLDLIFDSFLGDVAPAIRDSLNALVGRDLIQRTDYDYMVQPWVEVFGKVHPDD